MDGAQVTAAIALLKKVMPDLASVEQVGEVQKPVVIVTGVPRPWDKPIDAAGPSLTRIGDDTITH